MKKIVLSSVLVFAMGAFSYADITDAQWGGQLLLGIMPISPMSNDLPYDFSGSFGVQVNRRVVGILFMGIDAAVLWNHARDDGFSGDYNDYPCPHSDFVNYAIHAECIGFDSNVNWGVVLSRDFILSAGVGLAYVSEAYSQIVRSNATGWFYKESDMGSNGSWLMDYQVEAGYSLDGLLVTLGFSRLKGFVLGIGLGI